MTQPEDVVRWHEQRAAEYEEQAASQKRLGTPDGWSLKQAAFHRGAAASLRQLMEENERLRSARSALEDVLVYVEHRTADDFEDPCPAYEDLMAECDCGMEDAVAAARRALSPTLESEQK